MKDPPELAEMREALGRSSLRGGVSASFEGAGARIRLEPPLELRGPVYRDGVRSFYLRNITAGIFAGDEYRVAVTAAACSEVRIASTSATKVHRMPTGTAKSHVVLRAEHGGRLLWGPNATILQAESDFTQRLSIHVEPGAMVYVAEVLVLGRLARGEESKFQRYASDLIVDDGSAILFEEHYELVPGPALATAMGGHGCLVSVYALAEYDRGVDERLSGLLYDDRFAGMTRLPNRAGLVVRALRGSLSAGTTFAERVFLTLAEHDGCIA